MTSSFNVNDATGYEQLMGRWSQKLAPLFIDFAGVAAGEKLLDVGCGTGSLTFALARAADLGEIAAIDYSPVFVAEAIRRNTDPRINIRQADACALPFEGGTFDRALALLVLHFVPEAGKAVAEMRRVVRPGGVVAAAVWDHHAHAGHTAEMVPHGGGTQRKRAPVARPLLLPANDAAG
jgi:ubiquinone/menaquinone biosynthesis C-methylase UbiE